MDNPDVGCPTPGKRAYRSKAKSNRFHRRTHPPPGQKKQRLWPYECACGAWHLTHHRGTPTEQAAITARMNAKAARQREAIVTDPKIRLLFTRPELAVMGRCVECGWHEPTQGHHPDCPTGELIAHSIGPRLIRYNINEIDSLLTVGAEGDGLMADDLTPVCGQEPL